MPRARLRPKLLQRLRTLYLSISYPYPYLQMLRKYKAGFLVFLSTVACNSDENANQETGLTFFEQGGVRAGVFQCRAVLLGTLIQ